MTRDPGIAEEIRRYQSQYVRNPGGLAFARLADAYRRGGESERALELLERGLERHPSYLSGLVVRARTLADLDRHEAAIDAFRRVLELDPRNRVALRELARIAWRMRRLDEAAAAYRRLYELDPQDEELRERLAELEDLQTPVAVSEAESPRGAESSRGAESLQEAEPPPEGGTSGAPAPGEHPVSAEGGAPDSKPGAGAATTDEDGEGVVVTATMAELLLRQGLYEQALRILERLLERRPGDPLLVEKRDTARRLARGEVDPGPASGSRSPAAGADGASEAGVDPATKASGETAGEPRGAEPSPDASAGDEAGREAGSGTIREYLERLLEGSAEVAIGSGGSPFARWLRDSDQK